MLVKHSFVPWALLAAQVEAEPAAYRREPAVFLAAVAQELSAVWERPVSSLLMASASLVAPGAPAAHMVVAAVPALASLVLPAFVPVVYRPEREAFAEPEASGRLAAYMTG